LYSGTPYSEIYAQANPPPPAKPVVYIISI
jgi:hypothetical protein